MMAVLMVKTAFIQLKSLDGRGPEEDMGLNDLHPSTKTSLQVPEIMEQRSPAAVVSGKTEPGSIIQTN